MFNKGFVNLLANHRILLQDDATQVVLDYNGSHPTSDETLVQLTPLGIVHKIRSDAMFEHLEKYGYSVLIQFQG
jgi:hypothetical protein